MGCIINLLIIVVDHFANKNDMLVINRSNLLYLISFTLVSHHFQPPPIYREKKQLNNYEYDRKLKTSSLLVDLSYMEINYIYSLVA